MRLLATCLILPLGLAAVLTGCQKPAPAPAPGMTASAPAAGTAAPAAAGAPAEAVDPAHPETKWIGSIPYDVFFDQPLTVAADSTALATVASTAPGAQPMAPTATPMTSAAGTTTPAPAAGGPIDWQQLAPIEAIVDEVKQIRVRLERNLQKVGDFNKNTASISQDGALLAALAVVIPKHPGAVNWKDKANFIRDLGNQIYTKAEGSGMKPFNATKTPFEDVKKLLDGESPTGTAKDDVPFAEVADRGALMQRLNSLYESVKSNVNTAARLKEEKDKVIRDLAIMNLMMTVMADHSYDQADDARYVAYVRSMMAEQKAATEAATAGDFDAFSTAIGKINNTCNECHMVFRTGSN